MPVVLLLVFAFLFSGEPDPLFKIGVADGNDPPAALADLLARPEIRVVPVDDLATAVDKVGHHRLDMLLDPQSDPPRYWINPESANGRVLEQLLLAAFQPPAQESLSRETVAGKAVRYVDWVLPGILALNMMFSSLWGVGWVIVRYRKNGVLRRLRATPLTAFEFLAAQIISRLLVVGAATVIVYLGTHLLLDFPMRGSYLALILLFLAGSVCMISIGLIVASRIRSEELADGLLNLISWPMMIASGVWFSMEGTHPLAQAGSQLFPLTHVVEGARRVMLDGAGVLEVAPQIALLAALAALLLGIATRLFRWQ